MERHARFGQGSTANQATVTIEVPRGKERCFGGQTESRQRLLVSGKRDYPPLPSPASTETPRPLLAQQDTIPNTSGSATFHTNLHEKICLHVGVESVPATHIAPECLNATCRRTQHSFRTFKEEAGFQVPGFCGGQCVCFHLFML